MTSLKVPLKTVKQVLDDRRRRAPSGRPSGAKPDKPPPKSASEVEIARHMLADKFAAQAKLPQPARHLLIKMLKEAADLIYSVEEPPLAELTHLGLAARGLHSSSPTFWRYSAEHGACALRDPIPHPAARDVAKNRFTRPEFDQHLANTPPPAGTPKRDARPAVRPASGRPSATRGRR